MGGVLPHTEGGWGEEWGWALCRVGRGCVHSPPCREGSEALLSQEPPCTLIPRPPAGVGGKAFRGHPGLGMVSSPLDIGTPKPQPCPGERRKGV